MDSKRHVSEANGHLTSVNTCLEEVGALLARLEERDCTVAAMNGLPTFIRNLQGDRKTLERTIAALSGSENMSETEVLKISRTLEECIINTARATRKWAILKRCHSFVALNQGFQGSSKEDRKREMARRGVSSGDKQKMHRVMKEQGRVEVDVVDGGREWIVMKSLGRDRLARQMTDCGWEWGEHKRGDVVGRDEWEDVPLVKVVARVVAAARRNRCEYRVPRIRVILTSLARGEEEFDVLLEQIEKMDPSAKIIIDDMNGPFLKTPPPDPQTAIDNLLGDEHEGLTPTLNMDHTILIDLISDITHAKLEPQPWQTQTTSWQIEEENGQEGGIMAKTLYPLLRGRALVCTMEGAEHFHEVLKTVGTETERRRGRLIVPFDEEARGLSISQIREEFQALSIHALPADITLPITILPSQPPTPTLIKTGHLPPVAAEIERRSGWKPSKLSIFTYGWASGTVTLTSNREIRGQMKTMVEEWGTTGEERGPGIWKVNATRNLLAKGAAPREGAGVGEGGGGGVGIEDRLEDVTLG